MLNQKLIVRVQSVKPKVTKAVITAAGRGTRFLPVTKGYAKELVAVLGKPQIQYLVEEAIGAGITEICIVCRHGEKSIRNYFKQDLKLEKYLAENGKSSYLDSLKIINQKAKIKFISQPQHLHYGTGSPVLAAKSFIGNAPFVLMYGDDLIVEPKAGDYLKKMLATFEKYNPAVVLCVKDVGREEIYRYGSMKFRDDPKYPNRISGILEKLPADEAPSTFAMGGRFVIDGFKILPVLSKQELSILKELLLTDPISTLAENDIVLAQPIENEIDWMTTGDPLSWLMTNNAMALNDPKYREEMKKYLKSIYDLSWRVS